MFNKKMKIDRRAFLNKSKVPMASLLFSHPLGILFDTIVRGALNSAYAESMGTKPRRYIQIFQSGAPERWMFDLFLTPYSNSNFSPFPHLGTRYTAVNGRYEGLQYSTITKKGIQVPPLWQSPLASSSGGLRPMDELLENMLVVRGLDVGNSSHSGATALQFYPNATTKSITALASDASSAPIPAITDYNSYNFKFHSQSPVWAKATVHEAFWQCSLTDVPNQLPFPANQQEPLVHSWYPSHSML